MDTPILGVFPDQGEKDLHLFDAPAEDVGECRHAEGLQALEELEHVERADFFLQEHQLA